MISPHGGKLVDQMVAQLDRYPANLVVDANTQIDIYNIATGAYSPITGFADAQTFSSIMSDMTLPDGSLWSIPIVMDISAEQQSAI